MRAILLSCAILGAFQLAGAAESSELNTPAQKFAYGLGMSLGNNLKRSGIPLDQVEFELLMKGAKDALSGGQTLLSEADARQAITDFQREARTAQGQKNKVDGAAFLAANKSKEGVKTHMVALPNGQSHELQYKVLAEGQGESPKTNDLVTVHYRGTLIDGTEFDSSHKRGAPATFGVNQVIAGWTAALGLMKPGAKWQLFLPSELAYGERGSGASIGPNATLLFDVELISVQSRPAAAATAPPATSSQPITSDIIKVPSKEELEKGAKIEVIKASDLEKYKQQEKEKADKAKSESPGK